MTLAWAAMASTGGLLVVWAGYHNPIGIKEVAAPLPPGRPRITTGPYRWLRHPIYLGDWLLIVGLAGLAAGFWNAFAMSILAELLLRDWALRER